MYVIVDGNAVGYAAHGSRTKLTHNKQDITGLFQSIGSILKIRNMYPTANLVVLWDGRSWRYNVYPEYKGTRDNNAKQAKAREEYKAIQPFIVKFFDALGIKQIVAENMEADDIAAKMVRNIVKRKEHVVLFTGDGDWMQMIDRGVTWVDTRPQSNMRVNKKNFSEVTGCANPRQFVERKAVCGDSGDNIKGVRGVGEGAYNEIISIYRTIENFLSKPIDEALDMWFLHTGKKKMPKKIMDFLTLPERKKEYYDSLFLVDLNAKGIPEIKGKKITGGKPDFERFLDLCKEFNFTSYIRKIEMFEEAFGKGKQNE